MIVYSNNITCLNFWKSRRYILALLASFGFLNVYALRSNLSVAIVDMTQLRQVKLDNGTVFMKSDFNWDSKLQGYVLSSFFYGYVLTQIIGGYVASRIGGAKVFGIGIAVTSLLTIITPIAAKFNVYLFIVVRALEGFFEGTTYPACNAFYAKWAPPLERTRLIAIAWSGGYLGAVVSMPFSSLLATYLGWESIFYFFGGVGLIWYIFWIIFARDAPEKDSRISKEELLYIRESINATRQIKEVVDIPIRHYVTSLAVWANALAFFSEFWGFYTLLTCLPNFMKNILKFDLNSSGMVSGAPYLAMAIMIQFAGQLGDWILTRNILSRTNTRKVFTIIGFSAQAIFLLIGSFWMSHIGTSICLILAVGIGAFAMAGFGVSVLDLAPRYGGTTMGYCNTFGAATGVISPIVTGYIVTDTTSVHQWRIIFYIAASIYVAGAIFYGLFGSSDLQAWGREDEKPIELNNTKHKQNRVEPD
ncbi:sialin-like isoform X2 [Diabrotica virgifera virgifera]|uniref:Sialin n=1 Tax=Diabrotica virgifera virgifera TaxID=50390 RepID=A0A6P7GDC2_DIAVI|nr:sialin-like isoform X2 [Diabrotica virgifera virgifera]XP_028142914.1 sialin-like isoform X2 [Diabrotica virgifera virgifera]